MNFAQSDAEEGMSGVEVEFSVVDGQSGAQDEDEETETETRNPAGPPAAGTRRAARLQGP